MSFFQQIASYGTKRLWQLTIVVNADKTLNVLVQHQPTDLSDKSLTALPPKQFKGTAEKFDNDLFNCLEPALLETEDFFRNATEFQTKLKEQKGNLQERIKNPGSTPTPRPPVKDAATKQFEELMKKVDELVADNKIGQAIAVLTKATVNSRFVGQKELRLKELKAKHGGFNLFDQPEETPTGTDTVSAEEPDEDSGARTGLEIPDELDNPEDLDENPGEGGVEENPEE
ncbi:hypothetical protein [Puia dinghuensis]|uniref:ParB-related ThiF-related cassette protein E domain-containing protein n=1 Tax=Puia dinghuensis TaxID=1792502 RepID=A0A8J2UBJ2_9BACT|nr:hypothetical protein [Puia dinghuensis]GGA92739.1 hypothetical protein GCM10011511_15170 [Puia dinghuensis]